MICAHHTGLYVADEVGHYGGYLAYDAVLPSSRRLTDRRSPCTLRVLNAVTDMGVHEMFALAGRLHLETRIT